MALLTKKKLFECAFNWHISFRDAPYYRGLKPLNLGVKILFLAPEFFRVELQLS